MKTPIEALEQARETFRLIRADTCPAHVSHECKCQISSIDAVLRTARCTRCRGTGKVTARRGTIFETDSAEERALAFRDEPCPVCRKGEAS